MIRRLLREPLRRFLVVVGGCADLKSNLVAGSSLIDIGDPTIDSVNFDASYLFRLGEDDSDVAFHDSELFMIDVSAMYRFGAR